jgi:hypothetical protein
VPQLRVLGIWQVPLPSQVAGGVATLPLHEPDRQVVPATWRRQPPLPSHLPSRPQVDALSAVQARMGSSAPAGTGAQLPARPLTLQDWQLPQLAVSQQTPLVQKPLAHSLAAVQVRPSAFTLPHAPFTLHRCGAAQSAAQVQVVRQALVVESQRYGAQAWGVRVTPIPLPSHWGARSSPRPSALQRGAPQVVPAACLRQAPAPSQTPSSPQVLGCVAVQPCPGTAFAGSAEGVADGDLGIHRVDCLAGKGRPRRKADGIGLDGLPPQMLEAYPAGHEETVLLHEP